MLKFNDGVNIDTSGPLRKLHLSYGLYVVGNGKCIPVNSEEEANNFINPNPKKKKANLLQQTNN